MRGEHGVEGAVGEGQRDGVALHRASAGQPRGGDLDHRRALVEAGDVAAEVARDEAGAAGDVERAAGVEARDDGEHGLDLRLPAGPLAAGEQPRAEPPVVVLGRTAVVVRAHRLVDDAPLDHDGILA